MLKEWHVEIWLKLIGAWQNYEPLNVHERRLRGYLKNQWREKNLFWVGAQKFYDKLFLKGILHI